MVKHKTEAGEVSSPSDDPLTSVDQYSLSVEEVLSLLGQVGISKSKDSIQRYCREGTLNCMKLGMLRRYYATEDSVTVLIENLLQDIDASSGMHLHEVASINSGSDRQLHDAAHPRSTGRSLQEKVSEQMHQPAFSHMQADEGANRSDLEAFYRDQIRIKDDQLRVKDEQIAAMLERDRETNFLIRELHGLVSKTFNLVPGSNDARGTEPEYRRSSSNYDPHNGENRSRPANQE